MKLVTPVLAVVALWGLLLAGCQSPTSSAPGTTASTVAVTGVTLGPTTLSLTAGGATGTLTASVAPTNATTKTVTWSSSNTGVATVANGVVTPVAAGTATITVKTTDGNFTATASVTVGAAPNNGGPQETTYITFTGSVGSSGTQLVAEYESLKTVVTDDEGNFSMTVAAAPGTSRTFAVVASSKHYEPITVTEGASTTQAVGTFAPVTSATDNPDAIAIVFDGYSYDVAQVGLVRVVLYRPDGSLWKRTLSDYDGFAYFADPELGTDYKVVATHDSLSRVEGTFSVADDGDYYFRWTPQGGETDEHIVSKTNGAVAEWEFALGSTEPAAGTTTNRGVIQAYTDPANAGKTVTLSAAGLSDKTAVVGANGRFVFENVVGKWGQTIDYTLTLGTLTTHEDFDFGGILWQVYLGSRG